MIFRNTNNKILCMYPYLLKLYNKFIGLKRVSVRRSDFSTNNPAKMVVGRSNEVSQGTRVLGTPAHWYPDKIPTEKIPLRMSLNAVEREIVPTKVLNPNASEANYKPKQ